MLLKLSCWCKGSKSKICTLMPCFGGWIKCYLMRPFILSKPPVCLTTYLYVCTKFFNVNSRAKLKTCLQPGSQNFLSMFKFQAIATHYWKRWLCLHKRGPVGNQRCVVEQPEGSTSQSRSNCSCWCVCFKNKHWPWSRKDLFLPSFVYSNQNYKGNHWDYGKIQFFRI